MGTKYFPGTDTWVASDSHSSLFSGVFEDDTETAYFYAYDRGNEQDPILDAVHIYNVANVTDRDKESEVDIVWSTDGLRVGLFINRYLHAVIDFEARKAYCRSEFPPPGGAWAGGVREAWNDSLANLLK